MSDFQHSNNTSHAFYSSRQAADKQAQRELEAARHRIRNDYKQQIYAEEEENPHPVAIRRLQEKALLYHIQNGDVALMRETAAQDGTAAISLETAAREQLARLFYGNSDDPVNSGHLANSGHVANSDRSTNSGHTVNSGRSANSGRSTNSGHSANYDPSGNPGLSGKIPSAISDVQIGRLSDDLMQQEKYLAISGITLYTRAAIDGGVPEHIAYTISDVYIREITQQKDQNVIATLMADCIIEFTEKVAEYKYQDCSAITRGCCQYIQRHLHEPLTLEMLAKQADRSPHYISDLFARELHIRPIAYIRKEKLRYAAQLLELTNLSVYHIAELVAFPSASAFAGYFRKEYGCTPMAYRNRMTL